MLFVVRVMPRITCGIPARLGGQLRLSHTGTGEEFPSPAFGTSTLVTPESRYPVKMTGRTTPRVFNTEEDPPSTKNTISRVPTASEPDNETGDV